MRVSPMGNRLSGARRCRGGNIMLRARWSFLILGSFLWSGCPSCDPEVVSSQTPPLATLSSDALDFGEVPIGETVTRSVTLTNSGDLGLEVSALNIAEAGLGYSVPQETFSLTKNKNREIDVSFTPPGVGDFNTELEIETNVEAPSTLKVSLRGSGTSTDPCVGVVCDNPPGPCYAATDHNNVPGLIQLCPDFVSPVPLPHG